MQGQTIDLSPQAIASGRFTLGRDNTNSLQLDDRAASRHHCEIRINGESFLLADLDSRNGTFVNGLPVREHAVRHNDQIRVGDSVFVFQSHVEQAEGTVDLEGSVSTQASTQWKIGGSTYLDPAELPAARGTVRGLQVLLRISHAVQGAASLTSLEQHLLDTLLEAIPARAGAILLDSSAGLVSSIFAVHRHREDEAPIHIPSGIPARILANRSAVLSARDSESGPVAFVAVPLVCQDQAVGVLYLEASAGTALDQGHLELASAVGVIAGLAIFNLSRLESLRSENEKLQAVIHATHDLIGASGAMTKVYRFLAQAAPTDSTVLIGGESGTGKELVARALHRNSPRSARPFVAINCAALTESLLEDELFGHERGAFTGAVGLKKGKFEAADGGTIFLDEVGELASSLQAKLLRVLQEREFDRVGGTRPVRVDVRIVAATNRDLEAAVKANTFRQDLFFRLNVVRVILPPLRERREDIALLASHFARKLSAKTKRRVSGISPAAEEALRKYDWPGNVRELENAVERALVLGTSDLLLPEDFPESILDAASAPASPTSDLGEFQLSVTEAKRKTVREALERAGGVFTEAAKILGVHPNYLHRLVKNLGLR